MKYFPIIALLFFALFAASCSRLEKSRIGNAACFGGDALISITNRSGNTNVVSSGFTTHRVILIKERGGTYSVTISECPETGSVQKVVQLSLAQYPRQGDVIRLTSSSVTGGSSMSYTELSFSGDSLNASSIKIWSGAGSLRVESADNETFRLRSEAPIVFNPKSNTLAKGGFSVVLDITYDIRATLKP